MDQVSRRVFLLAAAGLGAGAPAPTARRASVSVRLTPRAPATGPIAVAFGVPLPAGLVHDARRVRVLDGRGRELAAAVEPLEPWRTDGRDGSLRAVGIRLRADLTTTAPLQLRIELNGTTRATTRSTAPIPIEETLVDPDGLQGPRVRAVLPAHWLCAAGVAGPQAIARSDGAYAGYERFVDRSFPGSLAALDSGIYHHWLFDRTTCWYTQYVRTGDPRFLDAAGHAAHFMRAHTVMDGPDAGYFTLKGVDVKYVYPRGMHLHYLLTGDDRALEAGRTMARFCLTHWDPVYRPDRYVEPPLGTDPEAGRQFWSPRHQAYGLLGVLHGWEMTGDRVYWDKTRDYIDALEAHQRQPPDGRPADGSFRQNWALYDPNETRLEGATSAWMTAILLDALFHAWLVTSDARIPEMIVRWCDFLDRRGFVPDGSRVYYVIDCLGDRGVDEAPAAQEQGMERHSTELAMAFAMGLHFTRDRAQAARFRRRFDRLFATALTIDANRPARAYNWAFQASSRIVYFMQAADSRARQLE